MNIALRAFREEDSAALFALTDENREYLRRWLPWLDATRSEADSLKFIQISLQKEAAGEEWHRFILVDGKLAGTLCLRRMQEETADLGYWLAEALQGQGITSQAVMQLIREAAAQGKKRFLLRCQPGNLGSAGVARKCGFYYEKRESQAENLYGRLCDLDHYTLVLN